MSDTNYDMVIIGGGLGGCALAKAMAERGARMLVLEREKQFRDRIRGEGLAAWGSADAQRLGLYRLLLETCAVGSRWIIGFGPDRDFIATTPAKLPALSFSHTRMQNAILGAAVAAGAEVLRATTVKSVIPGAPPSLQFENQGGFRSVSARLIIGADGRGSAVRNWCRFRVSSDPPRLLLAGVLLDNMTNLRDDAWFNVINSDIAQAVFIAPQGKRRARAYLVYRADSDYRLQGEAHLPRLIEECVRCGTPREFFAEAQIAGPLASFNGADNWVTHPYSDGVALIGDAAATSDPAYGQGMALTLRDVRVLSDTLLADDDWDKAAHAYASEHDRYYGVIHTCEDWLTEFFYGTSAEAKARRNKAMPLINDDPTRIPDHIFSGPELSIDEGMKARFFGEA